MSQVDWVSDPLVSTEHSEVARRVVRDQFSHEGGKVGVRRWRNGWWVWSGGRWRGIEQEVLEERVRMGLRDAKQVSQQGGLVPYRVDSKKVAEVVKEISCSTRVEMAEMPTWVGEVPEGFGRGTTVGFRDVCVDARTMRTVERTEDWFDAGVLPVDYRPGAACPRWERCIEEWGMGDEGWKELLRRWMGYCLMGHRKEAKWMLLQGKIRGGKGTICRVLQRLVGRDGYMSVSLDDLAMQHGLSGLESAKVLSVTEVSDLQRREGERACMVLKNIVGRDPITINGKWERLQRNVVVNAAPMMSSNQVPVLPNKGRGLSGKMLVLPFEVSFEGREDTGLEEELEGELEGIAAWAMEGAHRLERAEGRAKWPEPEAARRVREDYHLMNNPVDGFLGAKFVQRRGAFVSNEIIRGKWRGWIEENQIRVHVPRNELVKKLVVESSWDLRQGRVSKEAGGERGVFGMAVRMQEGEED